MQYNEVQPDTRVFCERRGGIKGTVLRKFMGLTDNATELVYVDYDEGGPAYNTPEQLDLLDEAAPEPKLGRAYKGSSRFWIGGNEYEVFNTTGVGNVRGYWACYRRTHDGTAHTNSDYVVSGAKTRKAAFETALGKLKVRNVVEIMPRRYRETTMSREDQEGEAYPPVNRGGWVADWHTDGYLIVFEDNHERGIVWPQNPIEAQVTEADGTDHGLDLQFPHIEAAVSAIRDHHLNSRA
ncbi:hypothetical protein [Streptomyces sp. MBT53]|uniref:hypothetical protein n=1 Tax=Streptomyces sp. MBT53 TaxID=1488384 RepID=UPI00191150B8|nr:hypothetical protein [Streptomyces sp. MBT53]MBK6014273.1 hypothetical protein [Streptomyces sp. MBT53]